MNESINLCFVDVMHHCSFDHWDQQKHCYFTEKSRLSNKCQHYQMDEYCQNLDAYPTARTVRVKAEDLPKKVDRGVGVTKDNVVGYPNEAADILEENAIDHMSEFGMMPERSYVTGIWNDSAEHLKRRNNMRLYNNALRYCIDKINISPTAPMFGIDDSVFDSSGEKIRDEIDNDILKGIASDAEFERLLGTAYKPIKLEPWRIPASRLNLRVKKVV